MFILEQGGLDFDDNQLPKFVASVSNHQYGKKFTLNENIASGDFKLLQFQNGFYAYVSNYILHQDFALELAVAREDYFALHINQIQAGTECKISLNGKAVSYDDKIVTALALTKGTDSFILSGTKNALINRLKIVIPKTWIAKNLPAVNNNLLDTYFRLQEDRLFMDAIDTTYRSMVDKVMNTEDNAFYLSVTQNIVAVITERFFNRLNIKIQKNQKAISLPEE